MFNLSTFKNMYYIIEKLGLLVHLKLANSEVLIKLLFESRQQKSNKLMVSHSHERSSLSGLGHTDNACKTFPQKGSTALLGLPKTTLLKNVFNLGF